MGKVLKYELYLDGQKVKEGCLKDIANFLNIEAYNLKRRMQDGWKYVGEYKVVRTNIELRSNQTILTKQEPRKVDYSSYDEVVKRLKKYGNTICMRDPTCYLPDLLEKEGLNCRIYEKYDCDERTNKLYIAKGTGLHYLIEVV